MCFRGRGGWRRGRRRSGGLGCERDAAPLRVRQEAGYVGVAPVRRRSVAPIGERSRTRLGAGGERPVPPRRCTPVVTCATTHRRRRPTIAPFLVCRGAKSLSGR